MTRITHNQYIVRMQTECRKGIWKPPLLSAGQCFWANLPHYSFALGILLHRWNKVTFRCILKKLWRTVNWWGTNGWHCWRQSQGSVRWLQPTTSEFIFKWVFIPHYSCTLSGEALSSPIKQKRTAEWSWCAKWSGRVDGGEYRPSFSPSFPCFFLSSYSGIHYDSLFKLRSLRKMHLTTQTQEKDMHKYISQPVWDHQTLLTGASTFPKHSRSCKEWSILFMIQLPVDKEGGCLHFIREVSDVTKDEALLDNERVQHGVQSSHSWSVVMSPQHTASIHNKDFFNTLLW